MCVCVCVCVCDCVNTREGVGSGCGINIFYPNLPIREHAPKCCMSAQAKLHKQLHASPMPSSTMVQPKSEPAMDSKASIRHSGITVFLVSEQEEP